MKSSHVPHKSLVQVHATFMPDAVQTVNRYPLYLSWDQERTSVLTSSILFRHLISGSLVLISLILTCHDPLPWLFLNAHHHGFWPQQLEVVWSLILQAGFEGPYPHLLRSYVLQVNFYIYPVRTRGALSCQSLGSLCIEIHPRFLTQMQSFLVF